MSDLIRDNDAGEPNSPARAIRDDGSGEPNSPARAIRDDGSGEPNSPARAIRDDGSGEPNREAQAIRDNVERSRFELDVNGQVVFADYRRQGPALAIYHVEAPRPLRGTGAAGRLMRGVAETARREGLKIMPFCGYAAAWIRRHREYRDLLG